MAAKKRSRKKAERTVRRLVCPKTSRGKKVHSSKGRCWIKTAVKKVTRKAAKRRPATRRRAKR